MSKTVTHSKNFKKIKTFYDRKLWSIAKVRACVPDQITAAEFKEITSEDYEE